MSSEEINEKVDMLYLPVKVGKSVGLYAETKSKKVLVVGSFFILLYSYVICVIFAQFMKVESVKEFLDNVEAMSGLLHVLGKACVIIIQCPSYAKLIMKMRLFWNTSRCTKEVKYTLNNAIRRTIKFQKFIYIWTSVTAVVAILSPVVGILLPVGIWKYKTEMFYKSFLITESIAVCLIPGALCTCDMLIFGLSMNFIIQFRILRNCLDQLNMSLFQTHDIRLYEFELKVLIRHHIYLLETLEYMKNVCSLVLCVEFVTVSTIISTELWYFMTTFELYIFRHGMSFVIILLQLAQFCIPIDYINHEVLAVADHIFSSNLYLGTPLSLRNSFLLIIQRSQRQIVFRAGGLLDINSATIINVLKFSWTICTLMNTMK